MPIRIAFGITGLDVGGAERTLVELAVRLDRQRWAPSVVCLQPPGPLAGDLRRHGIPVESLQMRHRGAVLGALLRWTRALRRQRPAILQTFLFHANVLGRLAGRSAGVPIIWSGIRVAERRSVWPLRLDRWTERLTRGHVCVSHAVRDFAQRNAGIAAERLRVIPNGVDLNRADEAVPVDLCELGLDRRPMVLAFVGRFDPQKGLPDLLAALARLAEARPLAQQLRVLLIGAGPLREELQQAVRRASLESVIVDVGWQPRPQDWLAAADGLILPSLWEGMPNVVLEAMAARLPVIATAVEGTSELVRAGETGWLVPPGDPAALAEAITDFLADPQRNRRFGAAGRERVAQLFTYDRMVHSYEQLWLESLSTSKGR